MARNMLKKRKEKTKKEQEKAGNLLTSIEDDTVKKSIVNGIRTRPIPDISSHTLLKIHKVL